MAYQRLGNTEFFQLYRFGNTRPPSDGHIASHGKWVESSKPPFRFYNGWYPIRDCSLPGHESRPGAGIKSVKDGQCYRNYKVLCSICDHPDNQPSPDEEGSCHHPLSGMKELYCGSCVCQPNVVAPKMPQLPKCSPQNQEPAIPNRKKCKPDAYWRYHDPHKWDACHEMPADCRAHDRNWFRKQIDCENSHQAIKQALRLHERVAQVKKIHRRHSVQAADEWSGCKEQARTPARLSVQPSHTPMTASSQRISAHFMEGLTESAAVPV